MTYLGKRQLQVGVCISYNVRKKRVKLTHIINSIPGKHQRKPPLLSPVIALIHWHGRMKALRMFTYQIEICPAIKQYKSTFVLCLTTSIRLLPQPKVNVKLFIERQSIRLSCFTVTIGLDHYLLEVRMNPRYNFANDYIILQALMTIKRRNHIKQDHLTTMHMIMRCHTPYFKVASPVAGKERQL